MTPTSASDGQQDRMQGSAALTDLLAEAKQLRDLIYYNAAPNSMVETHANPLGRVLFLIEKQVTRPYGE